MQLRRVGGNWRIKMSSPLNVSDLQAEGAERGDKATRSEGDPSSHTPVRTRGGRGNRLGVSRLPQHISLAAGRLPPKGVEPESASGRKQGCRGCRIHAAGPRRPAQGWGVPVLCWDMRPPSPWQKQQAAKPVTGVRGATCGPQPGAAARGHRRCRQRTRESAGRAPTRPSRCCTPARCPSRC